ncbi:MAG: A/G-specific adenine glycosylase [Dehalococcoidia bacterium]|nr:A/G-specific adenine glycosylase [Dehalococcoidia bacterium]
MPATTAAAAFPSLTPQRLGRIRARLLAWHGEHGDDFPWRTSRDPYAALVAGVCSQQTQMARVLPLWRRWMAAFPTLAAAAGASRARALRVWGRAGYPRRALALREAVRLCLRAHGSALPREQAALLALPGVGPFTAAVVFSFGFGDDAPAVDTNAVRVIGRLLLGDLQPARESAPRTLAAAAARLLPPGAGPRWNAALMEYGARVCTPRPRCGGCVVATLCVARPRFERGECAQPLRAQPRFEGSDRQWRGRILGLLRERREPLRMAALLNALAEDMEQRARVRRLLEALCADGLAWARRGRCGLGEPPRGVR